MSDVNEYMAKPGRLGGLGACSPMKTLEIRCSKIASEAILGQRQSRIVATWLTEYCTQFLFAKPADFEFPREKVQRLVEQQVE